MNTYIKINRFNTYVIYKKVLNFENLSVINSEGYKCISQLSGTNIGLFHLSSRYNSSQNIEFILIAINANTIESEKGNLFEKLALLTKYDNYAYKFIKE